MTFPWSQPIREEWLSAINQRTRDTPDRGHGGVDIDNVMYKRTHAYAHICAHTVQGWANSQVEQHSVSQCLRDPLVTHRLTEENPRTYTVTTLDEGFVGAMSTRLRTMTATAEDVLYAAVIKTAWSDCVGWHVARSPQPWRADEISLGSHPAGTISIPSVYISGVTLVNMKSHIHLSYISIWTTSPKDSTLEETGGWQNIECTQNQPWSAVGSIHLI